MSTLDDILNDDHRARLIPSIADSRKEQRTVSILLATLSVVRPLAAQLLERCEFRLARTAELQCYTEVEFPTSDRSGSDRPDGVLSVVTRKARWTALLEAKIDNAEISEEQVHRYAEIALQHKIDAVITLSNQLVTLPTHLPYTVPRKYSNRINFFHISWISVLTQASLILRENEEFDHEQAYILGEMVHYLKHPKSGVKRFDKMNKEWQPLVLGIQNGQKFSRSSPEIEITLASWHQEERDICLILSRRTGERVGIRISRKHQADPTLRLKDACDSLVKSHELRSAFIVPNACSDLDVKVNLQRRTISCSMELKAPGNKKRASARINWLVKQLPEKDVDDVIIRARWPGKGLPTQAKLSEIQVDKKSLESGRPGAIPLSFEVIMIKDIAGQFSKRKIFIEELEKLIPEFYGRIGERLRSWSPPPPSIVKRDPIEKPRTDEKSGVHHEDVISQSETKQSGEPQETEVVNLSSTGDP